MPDTNITISVFERNLLWEKKRFNKEQEWEELIVLK